jgi:hypothetical protein
MNTMRPDERASEEQIRREKEFNESVKGGLKKTAGLGLSAAGAGLGSRILPFLSEHIPFDLALKGISKISPKVGDFLKRGMEKGLNAKEGMDFVKDKIQKSEPQPAKDQRNIIEQYSPELHQFIKEEVTKGRPPLEAGALAQVNDKFKKVIKKLEEDHKTPFSSILQSVYGGGQYGGPVNLPQETQQPQQQTGKGQQALMAILQKIQQQRGG